jgi:hypothetical protein
MAVLMEAGALLSGLEPGDGGFASAFESLSVFDAEGLELPPNILFSRLPP